MKQLLISLLLAIPASTLAASPLLKASFADLNGKPQAIKQWQGKPMVVNYWATWCGPCRQEMPELIELQKKYQGKVQFIGIAIDEVDAVKAFIKPLGMNYPMLIGGNTAMDIMRSDGNLHGGLPFTVIYDAKGNTRSVELGKIKKTKLDEILQKL